MIQVDPQKLEQHTLEPNIRWFVWAQINLPRAFNRAVTYRLKYLLGRRGVFGGDWDLRSRPFTEREEFRLVRSLWESLPDYRASAWYAKAREEIAQRGAFSHKGHVARTEAELDALFASELAPLLTSMAEHGYRQREGADLPEAMIGRDGTLIKTSHGTHRLAAAKAVGAAGLFPLHVVGVHRDWLRRVAEQPDMPRAEAVQRAVDDIERRYR
ncbi:MAG: hypothetical protein RIG84_05310 [Roseovarius sp.]